MRPRSLLLVLALASGCGDHVEGPAASSLGPGTTVRSYTTAFPLTENPISDGGQWVNGGTVGLDWSDVSTGSGRAIGHQHGASFTDATALLIGPWSGDQEATATVYAPVLPNEACYSEVELRLRSTLSAHVNSGYEVAFNVSQSDRAYLLIVRWNGQLRPRSGRRRTRGEGRAPGRSARPGAILPGRTAW